MGKSFETVVADVVRVIPEWVYITQFILLWLISLYNLIAWVYQFFAPRSQSDDYNNRLVYGIVTVSIMAAVVIGVIIFSVYISKKSKQHKHNALYNVIESNMQAHSQEYRDEQKRKSL